MKALLEHILQRLLGDSSDFAVRQRDDEYASVFEVDLPQESMGKIIGKNGRMIAAIRNLLYASGLKHKDPQSMTDEVKIGSKVVIQLNSTTPA